MKSYQIDILQGIFAIELIITIAAGIAVIYYTFKKRRMKSKMRKIIKVEELKENKS